MNVHDQIVKEMLSISAFDNALAYKDAEIKEQSNKIKEQADEIRELKEKLEKIQG